ncbi:MAG: hypothetical protein CYPHOPRED_003499 [Cyphobasidiales sp. Tagirdzhanova-0007]|nr:MAG: hypothetical protein CYPHOPRED_003499 [Cyphobasidiales sp. Tagirdzhanova-0007]
MTISPTFFGAEPDVIDEGKHNGLRLFRREEIGGLRLMQSLDKAAQKKAQLYPNEYIDDTYFVWFGGFSDDDPYYYRIHSPVNIVEFDFHCGIFLTNSKPAKFHTDTVVRTPNGYDYAKELIRLWVDENEKGDEKHGSNGIQNCHIGWREV